jgi:hypothetical protein
VNSLISVPAVPAAESIEKPIDVAEAAGEASPGVVVETAELLRWQRSLLPLMTRFIVAMAAVFFAFSAVHLYRITRFIEVEHGQDIRTLIEAQVAKLGASTQSGESVLQNSLLLLEADTLDKRYHQASALLLSRIWSRQLAFITGMVMAFLGAVFILGKLSESTSNIGGGSSQWRVSISSASPGIILSFFGTILLVTTLMIRATLDTTDGPAYVHILARPAAASAGAFHQTPPKDEATLPLSIEEIQKLGDGKPAPDSAKK